MKKDKILEYFEGTPDNVYDTDSKMTWHWDDGNAKCFGYFPVSIDNEYELLVGDKMHLRLSEVAARKLMGRAIGQISEKFESYVDWIETQCWDKAYGLGRYWEFDTPNYPNIMAFWYLPSSYLLNDIVTKLNLDPSKFLLVTEDSQSELQDNMTVLEYIEGGFNGHVDTEVEKIKKLPLKIDPKIAAMIRSYNQPAETWQSRKEKEGWNSLAQRNATLYQENRQRVDEYYRGDPDTIDIFDDNTDELVGDINYRSEGVISFGFFQTTLDGTEKEFIYKTDICHHDICKELANNIIGKAMASEDIEDSEVKEIASSIYSCAAYKGRIFLKANALTTWNRVSSSTLENLLNLMGGVEKWKDLVYIVPNWWDENWETDEISQKNINVVEYIAQGYGADESRDKHQMDRDFKPLVDEWIIDVIRKYNAPNSTLAAKTAKLGNMTIAQYNSLIHQEEKEPKKTIKENNITMENNKYQEEFSNYLNIMTEALQKDDYKAYEYVKAMLDEAIEDSKHEKELMNEMNTTNFGVLNHIFENELPTLIKTNKKAVRNVIKLIKEDKNLSNEFSFYNQIRQYNNRIANILTPDEFAAKLYENLRVDRKTVVESNKKLMKLMKENNIIPSDFIDEENRQLYESGHNILTKERNLNTVGILAESAKNICNYMEKHKEDKKIGEDADEMIKEFEEKLKNNLNESEMSFVQQITDFRSPIAEQRKEKLFNKFKNECIGKINEMLKEDANNIELKGLSDQLSEMKFDKNNIVKDIAKLLEIRDILMDD